MIERIIWFNILATWCCVVCVFSSVVQSYFDIVLVCGLSVHKECVTGKIRPCNSEKLEARRTRSHVHSVPGEIATRIVYISVSINDNKLSVDVNIQQTFLVIFWCCNLCNISSKPLSADISVYSGMGVGLVTTVHETSWINPIIHEEITEPGLWLWLLATLEQRSIIG